MKIFNFEDNTAIGTVFSVDTATLIVKVEELVKVNRFYPSSKTCGDCGWINQELKLSDREWTCKSCGVVHDRDVNASRNILKEGLKNISAGTVEYTDGDGVRSSDTQLSVKSEAQPIASGVGG
jgi:putative transposase